MNKTIRTVLLLLMILAWIRGPAQVQDAGLWMGLNVSKRITPLFSVSLSEEVRMNENITEVGEVLNEISATYRFGKHFRIGAGYRYSRQRRVDDSYNNRHRFNADFDYRQKIKRLVISMRVRYESQYTDMYSSVEGRTPKNTIVPRLELKYNLPGKFEPYLYGEPYYRINNYRFGYGPFVQIRVSGGVVYSFNRMHSLNVYYLYQKEYNVKHPETDYVIGVGYDLAF